MTPHKLQQHADGASVLQSGLVRRHALKQQAVRGPAAVFRQVKVELAPAETDSRPPKTTVPTTQRSMRRGNLTGRRRGCGAGIVVLVGFMTLLRLSIPLQHH